MFTIHGPSGIRKVNVTTVKSSYQVLHYKWCTYTKYYNGVIIDKKSYVVIPPEKFSKLVNSL